MTKFNAWNVFKNGLNGQTGWSRQWRDPEPKSSYDAVIVGGGCLLYTSPSPRDRG